MKTVHVAVGIVLGSAAIGLVLTKLHDPHLLTTHEERIAMNLAPVHNLPFPERWTAPTVVAPLPNFIRINEVVIEGRLSRPPPLRARDTLAVPP